jgi:hypothetical protein
MNHINVNFVRPKELSIKVAVITNFKGAIEMQNGTRPPFAPARRCRGPATAQGKQVRPAFGAA